ncbi:iron hydrogenase [Multifurca ochricompacta]|uniref:Iron hydrogenase n=1 Tax=Multifurca ochricompacta TaxID=376703 RepID=A0AAD4M966_9AGAM|nr:iron hydrogenase [Multifurca ochricompacta]
MSDSRLPTRSHFNRALTLTDLNNYITPFRACIKPLEQSNVPKSCAPGDAATEMQIDASGTYYEVAHSGGSRSGSTKRLQPAEISLNDCLARRVRLDRPLIPYGSPRRPRREPKPGSPGHRIPVLSIAPQSLASLAAALGPAAPDAPLSLARMLRRVREFAMHKLGFAHVYDTTFAREVVLREHAREFFERKKGRVAVTAAAAAPMGHWQCLKFYNAQYATRDVDCVLTTGELLLLVREHGVDLSLPVPDEDTPVPSVSGSETPDPHPLTLESKTLRIADYVEQTLRDSSSGATVFCGATCYGFQNLQNVVQRVGRAAGVQFERGVWRGV